jgi:Glycosyltransferase Family 4
MNRLLALSYAFPPMTMPEAILSAKRLANLPGWRADVIAADNYQEGMGNDPELAAYAEAAVDSVTRIRPAVNLPWHRLGPLGRLPDGLRVLTGKTVKAAEALRPTRYDAMLSWSTWHSVHLAALRLKRRYPRLPWLAHFSDPWVDNPFVVYGTVTGTINRALERAVVTQADRILFTTSETVALVMAKYPPSVHDKVRVIPHGFDPTLYPDRSPPPWPRKIFRYVGNFYGLRSPEPLFRALAVAIVRRPRLAQEISIEIVGRLDPDMENTLVAKALPHGLVTIRSPVGYKDSLALMRTAHVLLVIDAPIEHSVFFPSKLADYLGAGRPIVGLTPPGASARILQACGHLVADLTDAEAGATVLLQAHARVSASDVMLSADVSEYSAAATGAALAKVLEEVTAKPMRYRAN